MALKCSACSHDKERTTCIYIFLESTGILELIYLIHLVFYSYSINLLLHEVIDIFIQI